jgi:hypothetical protein
MQNWRPAGSEGSLLYSMYIKSFTVLEVIVDIILQPELRM